MPRYVILKHDSPRGLHYDFLLETATLLTTWALAEAPAPGCRTSAEQLPDHRRLYLEYEGEISGGRGTVTRWDYGEYIILKRTPANLELALSGQQLQGRGKLSLVDPDCRVWQFEFQAEAGDQFAETMSQ